MIYSDKHTLHEMLEKNIFVFSHHRNLQILTKCEQRSFTMNEIFIYSWKIKILFIVLDDLTIGKNNIVIKEILISSYL